MRRWIDLVLERAAELRQAGVLQIGPSTATLAPYVEPTPTSDTTSASSAPTPPQALHPLDDPASYPDGIVPGFTIERVLPEEY